MRYREPGTPPGDAGEPTTARFLIIAVLALAVRLIYLWDVSGNPLYDVPVGDGRSYYEWAGRIAAGDWLGKEVFYQAPLYPYFLGVLRFLGFHGFTGIYVIQSFLGALACGFVFLAGTMFFSRRAGEIAGVLLAFYAPAVFFDGVLQKATLDFFFMSLLLVLLAWNMGAPAPKPWCAPALWKWIGIGAVLGLLSLTRENALVLIPVVAGTAVAGCRLPVIGNGKGSWEPGTGDRAPARWRTRLAWLTALSAGILVILMPVMVRNRVVGGHFVLTTSQMGPNFYMGNNPEADGTYMALRPGRGDPRYERADAVELAEQEVGKTLTPSEVSRYWMSRAFQYIRSKPVEWAGLTLRKTAIFWQSYEAPDEEDYYIYQEYSPLLRALGCVFQFGLICPVAAVGVVLTRREWRKLWLLYAMAFAFAASVIVFYVLARYRLAIVPILALFAGACIAEIAAAVNKRRRGVVVASFAGLIVLGVLVNRPSSLGSPSKPDRYVLAHVMADRGDSENAERNYRLQVAQTPDDAEAHYNLANLLREKAKATGRSYDEALASLQEATEHYTLAAQLRPRWPSPLINLGVVYGMQRDHANAEACFRKALEREPGNDLAERNLAECLKRAGQHKDATPR